MTATATILADEERPPVAGWIVAGLVVVAAHVLLALFLLYAREESPNGAETPPAIMIELAPLAVAPPAEEQMDVPPAPTKTEEAPPEETKPPEMAQPVEPLPPEPMPPVVEPPPVVVPEAPLAPKPEVVLAPPKPTPPPKPAPKVEKKVEKVVKREHKPVAERTAAPRHMDAAPSREAAAPQSESGAPSMSSAAWQSMVSARLNSVKRCPAGASGAHGSATVSFTITASGGVGGAHLAGSSGSSPLDEEAVGMVHRGSPYPPPPGGRAISLTVPIRFGC